MWRVDNFERLTGAGCRMTCATLGWARELQTTRPRRSNPILLPDSSAAWGWALPFSPPPDIALRCNWAGRCMSLVRSPGRRPCVPPPPPPPLYLRFWRIYRSLAVATITVARRPPTAIWRESNRKYFDDSVEKRTGNRRRKGIH